MPTSTLPKSSDTTTMKRDIDRTRGDLGETLEALGDRVSPKKVVGRAKATVADKVDDAKERLSPGRALRRQADRVRQGVAGARTSVFGDHADGNDDDGGRFEVPPALRSGQPRGVAQVSSRAADLSESVADSVAGRARSAPATARQKAEGNPLAAGLVAFGAGLGIAALLQPSDAERRAARQVKARIEPVRRQAVEAGRRVVHELQPAAQSSVEQVRERATAGAELVRTQAVSSAQQVKADAGDAGQEVADEARGAARAVKRGTARPAATTTTARRRRTPTGR